MSSEFSTLLPVTVTKDFVDDDNVEFVDGKVGDSKSGTSRVVVLHIVENNSLRFASFWRVD